MQSNDVSEVRTAVVEWREQGPLFATRPMDSGLEYLRGMVSGQVVMPPVAQSLGMEVVSADPGQVRFTMPVKDFLINHLGLLAGGIVGTVIDSALGCAVLSAVRPDQDIVTVDLKLEFLRPVTLTSGPVTVDAEVVHLGKSRALAMARASDSSGRLCAVGTSNCLIRPKPGGGTGS